MNILELFSLHILENIMSSSRNLSVDGHHTHPTYQLSELCSELGITLLSIDPNATRLLKQLAVPTFRSLKLGWKTSVPEWHRKHSDKILNKDWFPPILDGALKKYSGIAQLYWGFEPVACTHGIQKMHTSQNVLGEKTNQECTIQKPLQNTTHKMFKELVTSQLITELKIREG
jgi:hypothetical protein